MIPKIVHYCWFGKGKKPKNVEDNISQWKEILEGYLFIEWNECNFDINYNRYVKEAYEKKKYAFVSDIARVYALQTMGGVYLDTDIEVKKEFKEILEQHKTILGFEAGGDNIMTGFLASERNSRLLNEILESYNNERFIKEDGQLNVYPNTYRITKILVDKYGLETNNKFQNLEDNIAVYPEIIFSAMDFKTFKNLSDDTTYTVHHFASSWLPKHVRLRRKIKKILIMTVRSIMKKTESGKNEKKA